MHKISTEDELISIDTVNRQYRHRFYTRADRNGIFKTKETSCSVDEIKHGLSVGHLYVGLIDYKKA